MSQHRVWNKVGPPNYLQFFGFMAKAQFLQFYRKLSGQRFELVRETSPEASGNSAGSGRFIDLYTGECIPAERNAAGDFDPPPTSPLCLWKAGEEVVTAIE